MLGLFGYDWMMYSLFRNAERTITIGAKSGNNNLILKGYL